MLAGLGHRTAGFVSREALEGSERFEAFKRWTGAFGVATEPRWWMAGTGASLEAGRAALAGLRSSGTLPTAVVCSHDDTARSFVDALREQGLRCPEDVSVTGFEGHPSAGGHASPSLTTVDIHNERQAREAMRLLAKQLSGVKDRPEHVRVPVSLILRGSVSAPSHGGQTSELPPGER